MTGRQTGSRPGKPVYFSGSRLARLEDGMQRVKSRLRETLEMAACSSVAPSSKMPTSAEKMSSMLEFLLQNREMILKDKSITWSRSTLDGELSRMLDQGSTLKGKGCSPFWTLHTSKRSAALPSAAKIDCAASPMICWNTSSTSMESNSWFSTETVKAKNKSCQTTCCPLSRCFVADETENADTPPSVQRLRKVKLKLTPAQKAEVERWNHAARFTYNEAVRMTETHRPVNKMQYRNKIVTEKDNAFVQARPWLLATPKAIRQQAAFEACAAHKSGMTQLSEGLIDHFKLSKRRKRKAKRCWTMGLESGAKVDKQGKLSIFPRVMAGNVKFRGKLPSIQQETKLMRDKCGDIWLLVPVMVPTKPRNFSRPHVALDPGVRKFLTSFDDQGFGMLLGHDAKDRLYSKLMEVDNLDARIRRGKLDHAKRQRLRKVKMIKIREYKDLQAELHWKVSAHLTDNYSTIILPHLNVKQLVQKTMKDGSKGRRLRTKTVRHLHALSHGLFEQRLRWKCEEKGIAFISAHECYTSKTCSRCGQMSNVGSSETFTCSICGLVADRDVNAAKNIMLANTYECELPPSVMNALQDQPSPLTLSWSDI